MKIPIIIICVVGFLAGWIRVSKYLENREMKLAREYALTQGWDFSKEDTDGLKPIVAEFLSDYTFYLRFIRTVESGQRSLILFNCSYKHKNGRATRQSDSHGTACLVRSSRFPSHIILVDIEGRDWTEVMVSDKVDMGTITFAEKFLVISKDPSTARALVNTEIQNIMLQHKNSSLYNPVRHVHLPAYRCH